MKVTLYPTLEEAILLRGRLIDRFGGHGGVRDMGLLESALMRPRTGYYKTLSLQAAALLQSLCQNHCFVDGNKRVAFAMTAIFLRINGYKLKVSADSGESFMLNEVIQSKASVDEISAWLEAHMKK